MNVIYILLALVSYYIFYSFIDSTIHKIGNKNKVSLYRIKYVSKTVNIFLAIIFIILFVYLLGINLSQISIFLSSVFAVIGVALFAQWSILSNITASLIIFFGFPYRVGDEIRILDGSDDISGFIEEISLFHVLIKHDEELITYPNSLMLQKAVIKNPKPKEPANNDKT